MTRMLAAATGFAIAALAAGPAFAQDADEPVVNQVIVYGDQPCPVATGDEIVVCVRQEDPYRLPAPFRGGNSPENESRVSKVAANRDVGDTGVGSCGTVGPASQSGCTVETIEQAYAEKENADAVKFGVLVAEERAKRLAEIDEQAAEEQERVEQLERAYNERLRREAEGDVGPVDAAPLPDPDAAP